MGTYLQKLWRNLLLHSTSIITRHIDNATVLMSKDPRYDGK